MAGEGRFFDNLMVGDLVVTGAVKVDDDDRFLNERFRVSPVCNTVAGAAAATTGANLMIMEGRTYLLNQIATQTLVAPLMAATGLDVTGDQTADDGREIDFSGLGALGARSKYSYIVGRAFYGKLKFSIAVVLGTDICCFGFRKVEAHNADPAAYTDYAVLDVNNGNISVSTNLNSAGETNTDTTDDWADAETHTFEVYISAAGVATFKIDGVAPTVNTGSVTLDSGDVMIPFFEFLHDASGDTGALVLQDLECSYV